MEDILKAKKRFDFVSSNLNSDLCSVYLPKMVSRRWAAPKNPVARMRNLARGVITLFRQNIVTLAQILEIKCAKQFFHLGTSDGIVSHLKMA